MQNNLMEKTLVLGVVTIMFVVIFGMVVYAFENEQIYERYTNNIFIGNLSDGYTDITVEEAWTFLNDTSNGIQFPIDVRYDNEWKDEHIDTPPPENPRHHCVCEWDNLTILEEFMSMYAGNEIIIYCRSGGRSVSASEILVDNGFTGTIYNMLGGITAWKEAGFPTMPNLKPEPPIITGKINGKAGIEYEYRFVSNDPEGDDLNYYIDWGDNNFSYVGPFESGEEISLTKMWVEQGTYNISAKAIDRYLDESDLTIIVINMPRIKTIDISFIFNWFIDRHPRLFSLKV